MSDTETIVGFICCGIAVICWGSNFIPVKKFDTGDGMFFQWIMCAGVWSSGLIVQLARGTDFHPLAMLGGVLWCTGNTVCAPVIQMIGMGLGLLLWGSGSLVMGWASGRFGLFGIDKQIVKDDTMNIIGFVIALMSIFISFGITPSRKDDDDHHGSKLDHHLLDEDEMSPPASRLDAHDSEVNAVTGKELSYIDKMPKTQRRVVGCVLAVGCGILFGVNFLPCQYLIDHGEGSSKGIDYVFSHFSGIFLTSTSYFLIYCVYKRNKPVINPELVLPSFVSGVMWALAQISFFYANTALALVIVMPITSTGPGIIGMLLGYFMFQEIRGRKNLFFLAAAFITVIVGVALIAASRF